MIFSITGFAYLLMSFGFSVVSFRCFEVWKKTKSRMSKIFGYFFFIFFLTALVLGFASILGNFSNLTRYLLLFKDILFALGCGALAYLVIYFKSPKFNPWRGFWLFFGIGIISLFVDIFNGQPFITKSGGIDWGLPPIGYLLQFSLFLFTFLPMSLILFKQSKISQDPFMKNKSFLFGLMGLGGFLIAFVEMILEPFFNLEGTPVNESVLIILNTVLFTFLLTSERHFVTKKTNE